MQTHNLSVPERQFGRILANAGTLAVVNARCKPQLGDRFLIAEIDSQAAAPTGASVLRYIADILTCDQHHAIAPGTAVVLLADRF